MPRKPPTTRDAFLKLRGGAELLHEALTIYEAHQCHDEADVIELALRVLGQKWAFGIESTRGLD